MIAGASSTAGSTAINEKQKTTDLEAKHKKNTHNHVSGLHFPTHSNAPAKHARKDKNRAVPGMMSKSWSAGMQFTPVSAPALPAAAGKPLKLRRRNPH